MSVAAFYEGKARGETDEKYRVLGLAQLADFHAASTVPEGVESYLCRRAKTSPKRQNGPFSSRFYAACQFHLVGAPGQRENILFYPFLTPLRPAPRLNIHGKIRSPKAGLAVRISNFGFRVFSPGVFAPLVGALVFKTSGRLEESRQWVRFPYTPVLPCSELHFLDNGAV